MCAERGCGTDRACGAFDGRSATFKMFESGLGRQRRGSFHPTGSKRVRNYIYSKIISIFRFSCKRGRQQTKTNVYFVTIALMDNDGWSGFAATINHFRPRIAGVSTAYVRNINRCLQTHITRLPTDIARSTRVNSSVILGK